MPNRFGSAIARVMSVGARALGYFIFGTLLIIYRRDPRMIALFAGVAGGLALIVWLLLR